MEDIRAFLRQGELTRIPASDAPPVFVARGMTWRVMQLHPLAASATAAEIDRSSRHHAIGFTPGFFQQRMSQSGHAWIGDPTWLLDKLDTADEENVSSLLELAARTMSGAIIHRKVAERIERDVSATDENPRHSRLAEREAIRFIEQLKHKAPQWIVGSNKKLKEALAFYTSTFSQIDELGNAYTVNELLLPLLVDGDRDVVFNALYSMRFHFPRSRLRQALAHPSDDLVARADLELAATKTLTQRGIGSETIATAVRLFQGFISESEIEAHHHFPREDFMDVKHFLLALPHRDPEIIRQLLILSLLDDVPFEGRVLNRVPMDY